MPVLIFIEMASDLSLFMMAGGTIAVACGASLISVLVTVFILALAMSVSFCLRERKVLKFLPPVLIFAGLLITTNIAWIVVSGISLGYTEYVIANEKYLADREQQKSVFKITIGALILGLLIVFIAGGGEEELSALIVMGLISFVCSVLVMRSLRHEPAVYVSFRFQLLNLAITAAVMAITVIISLRPVINGIWAGVRHVYTWIAYAFMYIVMLVITGVSWLFKWISLIFGNVQNSTEQENQLPQIDDRTAADFLGEISDGAGMPGWIKVSLGILAIAAIIIIIILIFRYLSGRKTRGDYSEQKCEKQYRVKPSGTWKPGNVREEPEVMGVRKQYKKYLKFLQENGQSITVDQTSGDIIKGSLPEYKNSDAVRLRELYLKARYKNAAAQGDAETAKEMLARIKKNKR